MPTMKLRICFQAALGLLMSLSAFAQQRPAEPRVPQPIPRFFREAWRDTAAIPVTQAAVSNTDLELRIYGASKDDRTVNNEGGVPHVWTGLCPAGCAVVLRHKENLVDLTGKARIKWYTKTSGFHEIRPIVKLANGDWLVGDHADRYTYDFHETEFYLADVRWLKLDIAKVQTKGTLLDKVDLSQVDEIGFVTSRPAAATDLEASPTSVGWRSMAS